MAPFIDSTLFQFNSIQLTMSSSTLTTIFHQQPSFNFIPNYSSGSGLTTSLQSASFSKWHFPAKKILNFQVNNNTNNNKLIIMTKMVRSSGFNGGSTSGNNNDEGVRTLEHEADFVPNGLQSFMNRLSKWLVGGLFGVLILWRHDAVVLWAAMGSVVNVCLSITLKKILNQERPFSTLRSDPGMPSSHAQYIFYNIVFVILSMAQSQGMNELTIIVGGLILAFGSYLTWLRVSQRLHSPSQVIVGAAVGSVFSLLWFWVWDVIVLKAFLSFLWVRILLVLFALGYTMGYLFSVIQNMFKV